jgi:predicted HTH domain antitoxin
MATLVLTLPAGVTESDAKLGLAISFWREQRLTLGQAAKLAGIGKAEFMAELGKRQIPIFDYADDLEAEANL